MKFLRLGSLMTGLLLLAACVTINVYFPAAQAQQAADRIVEDVLGGKPVPRKPESPAPSRDDQSSWRWQSGAVLFGRVLDLLVSPVLAAEPDFSVDTPEIRSLQAQMKQRHQKLAPYYDKGAIGFARDASVGLRDLKLVSLRERARVKKLVAAENAERSRLYQAIARANGHPEWEPKVRAVFARTWQQQAHAGWWYQAADGRWVKK